MEDYLDFIVRRKAEYIEKYHKYPKYLIISENIVDEVIDSLPKESVLKFKKKNLINVMGLKVIKVLLKDNFIDVCGQNDSDLKWI